jgi:ribosome recycling factor
MMVAQEEILTGTDERMQKSVEALQRELGSIRTGRATPALVENLMIDYYGVPTPLNQLAGISVPEARVLMVQPWDKQSLADVEKGILKSDLGLVPNNDGTIIRINIPTLTEERRKDLVRLVGKKLEDSHIAVRNIRRDSLGQLKNLEKDKEISQDEHRRAQEQLQRVTDSYIGQLDAMREQKDVEVMEV